MKISNKIADLEQGKSCPQLKWICLLEEGILALDDWKVFNLVRQLEDTDIFLGGCMTLIDLQIRISFPSLKWKYLDFISSCMA